MRKIQKFAKYHVFADVTIILAMAVIMLYAALYVKKEQRFAEDVEEFNSNSYLIFLGTAVYTFEGVGIVLPIKDTCQNPQDYHKIVMAVMFFLVTIFIMFGLFNYFAYGASMLMEAPLITKLLPSGSLPVEVVMILFIINLFITYPLVIHPANIIIENTLYSGIPQSSIRKWLKNINRAVLVAITI